jgi:hypothetical protein
MNQTVSTANLEQPRLSHVTCASPSGLHRMAYWEWGDPHNDRVLLCVHGLTRTGRDFDALARRLSAQYRVVCPDVVGRGESDWLVDPQYYAIAQYVCDMLTLIARLNPRRLDWVGTSMGGLIGMGLSAGLAMAATLRHGKHRALDEQGSIPLGRMVLNDIGPIINDSGLQRIAEYVGKQEEFDSFDQAVEYVKTVSAGFGEHDTEGWRDLTRHVFIQNGGRWVKHYDLRIAQPMVQQDAAVLKGAEAVLWMGYQSLQQPVLVLRGATSDLLTEQGLLEMQQRNPRARAVTFPNVGHAPALRTADQIETVAGFLLEAEN